MKLFLLHYWPLIIIAILLIIVIGYSLKKKNFREWLLFAVIEAEKALGSKTGQIKLRYVYDLAMSRYPIFAKLIPFTIFEKLVNEALDTFKDILANNEQLQSYINKED